MARRKRTSSVVEQARERAKNLGAISPTLDLGNGDTVATFAAKIDAVQSQLDAYNDLLTQADTALNDLTTAEETLSEESNRVLLGVAAKYGKNSNEYEAAGGVRTSERKKPVRGAKTATAK